MDEVVLFQAEIADGGSLVGPGGGGGSVFFDS